MWFGLNLFPMSLNKLPYICPKPLSNLRNNVILIQNTKFQELELKLQPQQQSKRLYNLNDLPTTCRKLNYYWTVPLSPSKLLSNLQMS